MIKETDDGSYRKLKRAGFGLTLIAAAGSIGCVASASGHKDITSSDFYPITQQQCRTVPVASFDQPPPTIVECNQLFIPSEVEQSIESALGLLDSSSSDLLKNTAQRFRQMLTDGTAYYKPTGGNALLAFDLEQWGGVGENSTTGFKVEILTNVQDAYTSGKNSYPLKPVSGFVPDAWSTAKQIASITLLCDTAQKFANQQGANYPAYADKVQEHVNSLLAEVGW